ncbi:hypothetical protein Q1695_006484 [Nippostrongylus brasiliensis]|nr:hypothetical protein Q1695_006484 [Nippostrongylus brasiliensis]
MNYVVLVIAIIYAPSAAFVADGSSDPTQMTSRSEEAPPSAVANSVSKTNGNSDIVISSQLDGGLQQFPMPNWMLPRYSYQAPYYNQLPYAGSYGYDVSNGYRFNPLLYGNQFMQYQRPNSFFLRTPFSASVSDSDIQFSYLMTHPHAAMAYQGLAYRL